MTINHLGLTEELVRIHSKAGELDRLTREGMERLLFITLSDIELHARKAQEILNDLRYRTNRSK